MARGSKSYDKDSRIWPQASCRAPRMAWHSAHRPCFQHRRPRPVVTEHCAGRLSRSGHARIVARAPGGPRTGSSGSRRARDQRYPWPAGALNYATSKFRAWPGNGACGARRAAAFEVADDSIRALPGAPPLTNGMRLRAMLGTDERGVRLRLLDRNVLEPGQSAFAQYTVSSRRVAGERGCRVARAVPAADGRRRQSARTRSTTRAAP